MSIYDELKKPFPKDQIHFRIGATNKRSEERKNGKGAKATKGIPLAYIDARNVMERLDDVVGAENWQCIYPFAGCCQIGIYAGAGKDPTLTATPTHWVWKSNGAGETDVEGEKGQYSDAFKRAAVLWGIGQYLYSLPNEWVDLDDYGKYKKTPSLPNWALPGAKISPQVKKEFHDQILDLLSKGDHEEVERLWAEWDNEEKVVLWGLFNSKERTAMRKIQEEARQ